MGAVKLPTKPLNAVLNAHCLSGIKRQHLNGIDAETNRVNTSRRTRRLTLVELSIFISFRSRVLSILRTMLRGIGWMLKKKKSKN